MKKNYVTPQAISLEVVVEDAVSGITTGSGQTITPSNNVVPTNSSFTLQQPASSDVDTKSSASYDDLFQ